MRIMLAKSLTGLKMYGPIYDFGTGTSDNIEEYYAEDTNDWFLNNMVDPINAVCDTLLDYGDVDFIGPEKCGELIKLIDNLPADFIPDNFKELLELLKSFSEKAIEYNTGIEIEL